MGSKLADHRSYPDEPLSREMPCRFATAGVLSFLWYRTAPTRQIISVYTLSQLKRFLERMIEISLHGLALHTPS